MHLQILKVRTQVQLPTTKSTSTAPKMKRTAKLARADGEVTREVASEGHHIRHHLAEKLRKSPSEPCEEEIPFKKGSNRASWEAGVGICSVSCPGKKAHTIHRGHNQV